MQKIVAIIPAFNEEKTIQHVVSVLLEHGGIEEVLVVNDGSEDRTAERARAVGARVVCLPVNLGKGEALARGVELTKAPLLLFADADLFSLSQEHVSTLIKLMEREEADMVVGSIDWGNAVINSLSSPSGGPISGFRILKREIWEAVNREALQGYLVEGAVTVTALRMKKKIVATTLPGLSHLTKTKKRGFFRGVTDWLKMWKEIISNVWRLFSP